MSYMAIYSLNEHYFFFLAIELLSCHPKWYFMLITLYCIASVLKQAEMMSPFLWNVEGDWRWSLVTIVVPDPVNPP